MFVRGPAKRRILAVIGLELFALELTLLQLFQGVRTDEAKYLLNIPYPHPPLIRTILGATDGWFLQEPFWRLVFASLLVQAVWIVWRMTARLSPAHRMAAAGSWLLSAAILLQAGSIMMAPLTALEGLLFLWLWQRSFSQKDSLEASSSGAWIALLWFASLFTAYQAVLFVPLVWMIFRRHNASFLKTIAYVGIPLVLLGLYTVTNPFIIGAFLIKEAQGNSEILQKLSGLGWDWLLGGSLVLSLLGTIGVFWSKQWPVIVSFVLVILYIFFAPFNYYMILPLPFFVYGMILFPPRSDRFWKAFLVLEACFTVGFFLYQPPVLQITTARQVMRVIASEDRSGIVLINGSYGHEWQYESPFPIRRFKSQFLSDAQAVICLESCSKLPLSSDWKGKMIDGVQVFIKP